MTVRFFERFREWLNVRRIGFTSYYDEGLMYPMYGLVHNRVTGDSSHRYYALSIGVPQLYSVFLSRSPCHLFNMTGPPSIPGRIP